MLFLLMDWAVIETNTEVFFRFMGRKDFEKLFLFRIQFVLTKEVFLRNIDNIANICCVFPLSMLRDNV